MIFHTIYSPFYCYILTYVFLVNFTLYFTQHLYAVYILCIPHHYYYNYMIPGSKATDLDTYGLFCATHSHVYATLRSVLNMCHWHIAPYPIFAYRGIIIPLLCSYWGGSQGLSPTYERAHVGLDLLTLVSL